MARPVVAIVGRPNVGKSTFFNRCIGARFAIVDDSPGVTRDRIYHDSDWSGHQFLLIDTGGITRNAKQEIENEVLDQAKMAIDEADVIVFMVDGKAGITGGDEEVSAILRKSKKPIVLAVNKIDVPHEEANINDFYKLGIGEPYPVSALRGTGGVGDLLDRVVELFPGYQKGDGKGKKTRTERIDEALVEQAEEPEKTQLSVAIVGRPNVGKSSMINVLCGAKRSIVASKPGTTRDAIDTEVKFQGKTYTLIDTAGIRRKSRVDYGVEAFSVVRSLKAIERADVIVLMLDVNDEITDQDQKIAARIEDAGRAVVIVANKWDLVEEKSSGAMNKKILEIKQALRHLAYADVIFTSASNKIRLNRIYEMVDKAYAETRKRVGTGLLNQVINEAVAITPPPASKRGKRLRIYYATQPSVAPPTFILFANDDKLMPRSYQIYLERKLRESFGFVGTPLRIVVRAKRQK